MDRWDAVGAAGAGLTGLALCQLAGWPWAALFFGALLMVLYVLREMAAARARAKTRGGD